MMKLKTELLWCVLSVVLLFLLGVGTVYADSFTYTFEGKLSDSKDNKLGDTKIHNKTVIFTAMADPFSTTLPDDPTTDDSLYIGIQALNLEINDDGLNIFSGFIDPSLSDLYLFSAIGLLGITQGPNQDGDLFSGFSDTGGLPAISDPGFLFFDESLPASLPPDPGLPGDPTLPGDPPMDNVFTQEGTIVLDRPTASINDLQVISASGDEFLLDIVGFRTDKALTFTASVVSDAPGSGGVEPVPEPATLMLLGFGLAGLTGINRRRKRN